MTNTDHMKCLQIIADEDVAHLKMKERSYGSSWKKRGGVGAFMMMARKWDRIENILSKPYHSGEGSVQYDVFQAVQADPSGCDSSVLAEVRDLRRYLLLVEAEMMARGAVPAPVQTAQPPVTLGPVPGDEDPLLRRGALESATLLPPVGRLVPRDADGAQHASLTPWAVNMQWRYRHGMQPGGERAVQFDAWWRAQAPGVWTLEAFVSAAAGPVPQELDQLYERVTGLAMNDCGWRLKIGSCPPDARDWFPTLRRTLTKTEALSKPLWETSLYEWSTEHDKDGEFVLADEAWAHASAEEAA